jgi:hypothetical protein
MQQICAQTATPSPRPSSITTIFSHPTGPSNSQFTAVDRKSEILYVGGSKDEPEKIMGLDRSAMSGSDEFASRISVVKLEYG